MGAKTAKRLAILVTAILVAGLSLFFIQRFQVGRMDRSVLDQAAQAEQDGNYEDAARDYQEHLEIAADDWEAKLKLAGVLLKGPKDNARRQQAAQIYEQYVNRFPAEKKGVRRHLAELYVEMRGYARARAHLEILLKSEPDDGALNFLNGRCQEAINEPDQAVEAVKSYRKAVRNGAPQRPEADSRLATLLVQQQETGDADEVIEKMVQDHPENYRVYLERGSYLRRFKQTPKQREDAKKDLQSALQKAPDDPKAYTELAELARSAKNFAEARRIIEDGLKVLPNDPSLHVDWASLEMSGPSGSIDKAITSLRHSLERLPDDLQIRWNLANLLAQSGRDSDGLLTQIGELKRLNLNPVLIGLLEARNLINQKDWIKAIKFLTGLQQRGEQSEEFKPEIQQLLAQCYDQLGDRNKAVEAYKSSVRANPKDVRARWALVASYEARGDLAVAIEECSDLEKQLKKEQHEVELTQTRSQLARLFIKRNQQLPVEQREWDAVKKLIDMVEESAPESSRGVILESELLAAKDEIVKAHDLLAKARSQFPRDVEVWVTSAELMLQQRKLDDARNLLDQAQKSLGDSVALRLARSRLLTLQGGPDVPKALRALAENSDSFAEADRRRLLEALAQEANRLNDRSLVTDLWSEVAKLAKNDLEPRLRLFDLALQGKNRADIEYRLTEIKRIEGPDGSKGKLAEGLYKNWQIANTTDPAEQAKLRSEAQQLLRELWSRRQDQPRVACMLAELMLADLSQSDLSDDQQRTRTKTTQIEAAKLYLHAIELGQTDLATIRRASDLVYATKDDEVLQLWTQLFTNTTAGSGLLRQGSFEALRKRDNEQALKLAQKAKEANPGDFRATLLLVQMLIANQQQARAEKELRAAVQASPADPDRWAFLVQVLSTTKNLEKAEDVVRDAESAIKDKPLRVARCCEVLAQAYKAAGQIQKYEYWNSSAARWYSAARNEQPRDPVVSFQLIAFLFRSGQLKEVEVLLRAILDNKAPGNAEQRAWARRNLALTLAASSDPEKRREAPTLLEPGDQAGIAQQERDRLPSPEDSRVLVKVYQTLGTPADQKKARDLLERMDRTDVADPEDRLNLALMYSKAGEWGKAQQQYRKLLAQTENSIDLVVFRRRPDYIVQYFDELLKHYQHDQSQEMLSEAQDLIEKYRALRPNELTSVALEARLFKAQDHIDKARELIEATANRPGLSNPDMVWKLLAYMAEQLGEPQLAEKLLRQSVEKSDQPQNGLALALFLGRQGRVKEALDKCEPLWKATANPEELVGGIRMVLEGDPDKAQLERGASWMETALGKQPKSAVLKTGLAGIRERQGRFPDAEALYAQAVQQGSNDPEALNNLAWLMTLRNEDLNKALELINKAIANPGPIPVHEMLDTRGVIYMKLGDAQKARDELNQAITLRPTAAKYFHLAQAYLQAGDKQAAAKSWAKAHAQGQKPAGLHALEAGAYQQVLGELGTP